MGNFYARVNFYSQWDAVNVFCKLQGCQIYEGCCELDLYFASEVICGCKPYILWYMLDYRPRRATVIPWQHLAEDHGVSSLRSYRNQPISCLEDTNLAYLDAHDKGVVVREIKEDTYIREHQEAQEAIGEHIPGMEDYQVSDVSIATNVTGISFDQMNQAEEADCIDCIESSEEGFTQDQTKVIGHSNIYESNLPDIDQENL